MCFSPQADLVGGVVVGAIGIDSLRHVDHRRQLPLAALPLLFATHQLVEAVLWQNLRTGSMAAASRPALWTYLVIAFSLPLVIPLVMAVSEPDRARRRPMVVLVVLGGAVTALLLSALSRPFEVAAVGHHISYRVHYPFSTAVTGLYVVATCGAVLLSSSRILRLFGVINLVAVTGLAFLSADGLISLWCAWAAVTTVVINVHLRRSGEESRQSSATPVMG